eukprot:gene5900-6585_t
MSSKAVKDKEQVSSIINDSDSDSDESYYSGLEEDSDTSSEEEPQSDSSLSNSFDKENFDEIENLDASNCNDDQEDLVSEEQLKIPMQFEDADTSDEEDIRNTVGNIPLEWYNEYPHIGYDVKGEKILKPVQGDELEKFLSAVDDPDSWKTVHDKKTAQDVKLSDEDLEIIRNIQSGHYADKDMDPYKPYVDWFTGTKMIHPIKDNPEAKSSFVPSKWEHKRIMKLVRAIRNGWIKPKPVKDEKNKFYLLWEKDDVPKQDHPMHWPAPKARLPGHDESYNPPPEYIPNDEDIKRWEEMDPEDRPRDFIPKKYTNLRSVPGYSNFIQERFERCLDLYLCPRQRKIRLQVDPADLIPKIPKPRDLQPFPSIETLVYRGHMDSVTSISVDPTGQWLVSGSQDKTVRFWEVSTCRCVKKISFDDAVTFTQWNPNPELCLVAVSVGKMLVVLNPQLADKLVCTNTDNLIGISANTDDGKSLFAENYVDTNVTWKQPLLSDKSLGYRMQIMHNKTIKQGSWHVKGDYFAVVLSQAGSSSVIIHQLSKRKSQIPFKKTGGLVQTVKFHPTKPFLFVASQRYVRIYNLQRQELVKKLVTGVKWISSMEIHAQGDNVIIGSYDKRLCWFDIDLAAKPYKTLRHHKKAITDVSFHKCYPLFASASDDGSVIILHGKVFSDMMQNPLIVPVKIIRCQKPVAESALLFLFPYSSHTYSSSFAGYFRSLQGSANFLSLFYTLSGVTACHFHPCQPWIFAAGSDKTIKLYT